MPFRVSLPIPRRRSQIRRRSPHLPALAVLLLGGCEFGLDVGTRERPGADGLADASAADTSRNDASPDDAGLPTSVDAARLDAAALDPGTVDGGEAAGRCASPVSVAVRSVRFGEGSFILRLGEDGEVCARFDGGGALPPLERITPLGAGRLLWATQHEVGVLDVTADRVAREHPLTGMPPWIRPLGIFTAELSGGPVGVVVGDVGRDQQDRVDRWLLVGAPFSFSAEDLDTPDTRRLHSCTSSPNPGRALCLESPLIPTARYGTEAAAKELALDGLEMRATAWISHPEGVKLRRIQRSGSRLTFVGRVGDVDAVFAADARPGATVGEPLGCDLEACGAPLELVDAVPAPGGGHLAICLGGLADSERFFNIVDIQPDGCSLLFDGRSLRSGEVPISLSVAPWTAAL